MTWAEQIAGINDDMEPGEDWAQPLRSTPRHLRAVLAAHWLNSGARIFPSFPIPLSDLLRRDGQR